MRITLLGKVLPLLLQKKIILIKNEVMLYLFLILFYWVFAALFCFGAVFRVAKDEGKSIIWVFIGCIITGGILFPMYLGRSLNFDKYE